MSQKTAGVRAVARKDMTRRQWIWKEMKRNKVGYIMVAPYMILFTIFTVIPVLLSMVISFTDFNMLSTEFRIPDNYINLFLMTTFFL